MTAPLYSATKPPRNAATHSKLAGNSMKPARRISAASKHQGRPATASASLDDQVYARIYQAIAVQELPPGTRLREDQMRQIFGVSRARIRKVLSRLAFEGLVAIEPNRGASVARPSADEARENFAARRAIEGAIARAVAENFEAKHRQVLARHIAKESAAETNRDAPEMIRLSGEFHILLAEMAGNRTLQKFLRELITRESLVILTYEKPGKPSCSNHEHQAILDALTQRDGAKAARLMLRHLENVEDRLDLDRDARPSVDLKRLFAGR
jgi:DNA-binding GntR family transcriptional regulator